MAEIRHESLCWFCNNKNCQWMNHTIPLPKKDWIVEETETEGGSFNVYECKQFVPGKRSMDNAYPQRIIEVVVPSTIVVSCPRCKIQVQKTDRFCRRCGQRIYWKEKKNEHLHEMWQDI